MESQRNFADRLVLPPGLSPNCLDDGWDVASQRRPVAMFTCYDTFEWGLWFGGYLLFGIGDEFVLQTHVNGWPGAVKCTERGAGRRFWHDFSTDVMRSSLREPLGLRGLTAVATGRFSTQLCELRNEMGKIVCRIEWNTVAEESGGVEILAWCRVLPLRGYAHEAARVTERLAGIGAAPSSEGPIVLLLRHAHLEPRVYTLKPTFDLSFETPAREAVGRIVSTILSIADSNIHGIISDLDTEFLHDYRICLRKTRSLLGLVKDVYPAGETCRVRKQLGDLARATNRLRDLDVYLLARHDFLEGLPDSLHQGLKQIFAEFTSEREVEQRRVSTQLHGRATARKLRALRESFSSQGMHEASSAALLPVGPLVFRGIYRRYRKIRKIGKDVSIDTADEMLHQLRIECKKLRYLMEFFNELIPAKEGPLLQKQLRRLQGRLGDFNDSSVQQRFLLGWWHEGRSGIDAALAMGGLLALLYQRRHQARLLVDEVLQEFIGDDVATSFKRIFRHPAAISENNSPKDRLQ